MYPKQWLYRMLTDGSAHVIWSPDWKRILVATSSQMKAFKLLCVKCGVRCSYVQRDGSVR